MKRLIVAFSFVASCIAGMHVSLYAQSQVLGKYGFAQFASDSSHTMIEFYYDIPSRGLTFHQSDNTHKAAVVICNLRADQMNVVQGNENWKFTVVRAASDTAERNLVGVHRLLLKPGDYQFHVEVGDSASTGYRDTFVVGYRVRSFTAPKPVISSIELGRTLRYVPQTEESPFIKGGIEVTPNVRNTFADGQLSLVYYAEIYNLQTIAPQDSLLVQTQIMNTEWTPVYQRLVPKPHSGPAIAVAESLNIEELPSGRYVLAVLVISTHGPGKRADTTLARCDFTVLNSSMPALADPLDAQDAASSVFADKTEKELDTLFLQYTPIATKQERTVFQQLTGADAKRGFLFNFWAARNRDGGKYTLKSYTAAVDYTMQNFKTMGKPGWHTDRGRVYLQYGAPTTSPERHYFEMDSKPYEIWYYNEIQGGVQFVFVDIGGYGDFKLVHSDENSEMHDTGWQAKYAKNLMKGQ